MYSPKVTQQNILNLSQKLRREIIIYSPQYIASATAHLNDLYDYDLHRPKRELNKDERLFIENEQILSQLDFRHWCLNYAKILHWDGTGLRPFNLNIAQNIVMDILSEHQERQWGIQLQALKARQLGISTLAEALIAHRVQFYPYTTAVVASSDPDKTLKMHGMMERYWENQPWWLGTQYKARAAGELAFEFETIKSSVTRQHGTQKSGIARGDTTTVGHFSEISGYDHPELTLEASFIKTIHSNPWTLVFYESTAEREDDWWHRFYNDNKEFFPLRQSDTRAFFLPYFVGRDIYPTETFLREFPVDPKWIPDDSIKNHARLCAEFATTDPLLKKYYAPEWTLPIEQQHWYKFERDKAKRKKTLGLFLAEVPARDVDAFQAPHQSIFDAELIMEMRERTSNPKWVFAITSSDANEIPPKLHPQAEQIIGKPFTMDVGWTHNDKPKTYTFTPLRFDSYETFDPNGKLLMWEWPSNDEDYALGGDFSFGLGIDSSVLEIVRKGTFQRRESQVAEFFSPHLTAEDMIPYLMAISTFFSMIRKERRRQIKVCLEIRAASGETAQRGMQKLGWWNFHERQFEDHRDLAEHGQLLGWITDERSRKKIISRLISIARDNEVDIHSPYLVTSITNLQRNEDTGKIAAFGGRHDDHAFAFGIVESSLDMDLMPGQRETQYRKRKEVEHSQTALPERRPSPQALQTTMRGEIWKEAKRLTQQSSALPRRGGQKQRYIAEPSD